MCFPLGTGQDGAYLTELLLSQGYEVHGIVRRGSSIARPRLDHLTLDQSVYGKQLFLHYANLADVTTIRRILTKIRPTEIYHLAGQSHVGLSFDIPETTCDFTAMGTLRLLEIIRDMNPQPKFLNIGSSEIFGSPESTPQNEMTARCPVSPYGVAKAFAVDMVKVYRESFGMFACNAICYNHESPRRSPNFVTRKITSSVARIARGIDKKLRLGNLDVSRDWGFAGDYVDAMWRILQHSEPGDFVVATGQLTSLKDFLTLAFGHCGLNWEDHFEVDPRYMRPAEPSRLCGDSTKARAELGWEPSVNLESLVAMMVEADLKIVDETSNSSSL